MGMSTHICGFRPPDEKWRKMKEIWDSCAAADIGVPDEVGKFFDWSTPDEEGVEVDLENTSAVRLYSAESRNGYEIIVAELPKDIKIIRFFHSY